MRRLVPWVVVALSIALRLPPALGAQGTSPPPAPTASPDRDGACTYERCALGIAPAWNGLLVVRGASGTRVANLGFFWPGTLAHVFSGADSAAWYAARAVRVRRGGALLTNVGGLLLGYAAARRATQERRPDVRGLAIAGAAALAVSVPLQFAADGLLSRAVWWHNARYAP
jgi:hypothetical protein